MYTSYTPLIILAAATFFLVSCGGPEIIDDISDESFELINQDSVQQQFPDDFQNKIQVISFIYTYCPDVCPLITANMTNIFRGLEDTTGVHFIEISFDPARDTPSVLKNYMNSYKLNPTHFTLLTGDSVEVDSLMDRLGIFVQTVNRDTTSSGKVTYLMNHTNRILLMDGDGRIRGRYNGSRVPPEHVIEDINKLR